MTEEPVSIRKLVKTGFWTTVGAGIAKGLWELLKAYTPAIAGTAIRLVFHLIPSQKEAMTISHVLYCVSVPMLVIPFLYVGWRENRYVSHMYVKRDGIESGKIKVSDLTLEELAFLKSHWPDIFEK